MRESGDGDRISGIGGRVGQAPVEPCRQRSAVMKLSVSTRNDRNLQIAKSNLQNARPHFAICNDQFAICNLCRRLAVCLAVVILAAFAPATARADLSDEDATRSVKDTFTGRTRYPFYDRANDDVRNLNVVPPAGDDTANRKSKWK